MIEFLFQREGRKQLKFYNLFVRIKFQYKVTVVSNYTNHVFKISSTC